MSSETIEHIHQSVIERKAVYHSGSLGTLYDQFQDQMLEKFDVAIPKSTIHKLKTAQCKLIHGKTIESGNLLQMIGIQDDLRISILVNLVPRTQLTSIIDYPYPINEYTRFLHYTYLSRTENLRDNPKKKNKPINSSLDLTNVTHMITSTTWGIEFLAILQLPNIDEIVQQIDTLLTRISSNLHERIHYAFKLTSHEETILGHITTTKIYSNNPALASIKTIRDIYHTINQFHGNKTEHQPIDFTLCSIQRFYGHHYNPINILDDRHKKEIEQYLLQLLNAINCFKLFLIDNVSNILREHLKDQLGQAYAKWLDIKKRYTDEIERIAKLIINFRKNVIDITQFEQDFHDEQRRVLGKNIHELNEIIEQLKIKEKFIIYLQEKQVQYCNVNKYNINSNDNEQKIGRILIRDARLDRVLCSSDVLNQDPDSEFEQLRDRLLKQREQNPDLRLFYADFSYSSFELFDIVILPKNNNNGVEDAKSLNSTSIDREPSVISSPSETINVLLLGESGVGKSTFINAFVNYLTFETFNEAESNVPIVLIPISFMITTGENFEEQVVKFGESDETNNEDFEHSGQSVTQHCKSYVFDLNRADKKKLRIIDTPGFGDTRGVDQDDVNMQHILEYINNLSHLNAVCFLLKPNLSQLNLYFQSCLLQLFDLLNSKARENLIFCFTNTRTTFYTPGQTASLLRILLDSLPIKSIPFKKTNTFCFDNESFRYLVAIQNSIILDNTDKKEYESSWLTSVNESNRLLDYLCDNLSTYHINNQWKSIKHAQLEITHMIRPILETIRNLLRNLIFWDKNGKKKSIMLCPKVLNCPTSLCLSCPRRTVQCDKFLILHDYPHECQTRCLTCRCDRKKHLSIDYLLEYKMIENLSNHTREEMTDQFALLFNTSIEFTHFLMNTIHSSKENLFLMNINRMIEEERKICLENNRLKLFNMQLFEELKNLLNKYEDRMQGIKLNQYKIELPVIYERIEITRTYPSVREQINAMKQGQNNIMMYYETEIANEYTDTLNSLSTVF